MTLEHAEAEPSGTPTPYADRALIARSLLGHRLPSQHLCDLVIAAMQGADWQQIAEMDAAVRR